MLFQPPLWMKLWLEHVLFLKACYKTAMQSEALLAKMLDTAAKHNKP